MFCHHRGGRQAAGDSTPAYTANMTAHTRTQSRGGSDLRLSWPQLVTLFKLALIDPHKMHVLGGGGGLHVHLHRSLRTSDGREMQTKTHTENFKPVK